MVEKRISDKQFIYRLTRRKDTILIIKYNMKNKRAWFQTNSMPKRKAIDINRVVNLQLFFINILKCETINGNSLNKYWLSGTQNKYNELIGK